MPVNVKSLIACKRLETFMITPLAKVVTFHYSVHTGTFFMPNLRCCYDPTETAIFMMTQTSWAQREIAHFFSGRKSPSQMQCDEIAQSISGASTVRPVDTPGSMSYTVVCNRRSEPHQDLIISFREPGAMLEEGIVRLAKQIHGGLVPESTPHGNVEGADPPLFIYSMPYLQGSSCFEVLPSQVEMGPDEEAKHGVFMKDLAR
jgi:hypothetical protein